MDDATWAAEKAIGKAGLEWKEAIPLMGELKLKHKLQTLKAWLWASATVSISRVYSLLKNIEGLYRISL